MSFLQEFKKFAMRGNAVDLAVGVVIGAVFGKVVNSLVNDIIMPPIGALIGGIDFSSLAWTVFAETPNSPPVLIKYGAFINTVVDFTIVALAIFLVIKLMNKLLPPPVVENKTMDCPQCLMAIPIKAKKCGHCQTQLIDPL